MSETSFNELLDKIKGDLQKRNTVMRESIPPEERLVIAIRYLATGCTFTDLHYEFRVGKSTISQMVNDVCEAIWKRVVPLAMPKFSKERSLEISLSFEKYANFPHCIGAIDVKHIRLMKPANSGSMFYNYKGYFSIVLLAMCNANYEFTFVDIGAYGKCSDSGIFKNSVLYNELQNGLLDILEASSINGSTASYPYVIVGNEAFALSANVLKLYGGKNLTLKKKIFNYRLSRARRYIECTFGILVNKWRIFHRPLNVGIHLAENVVKATCALHNFVRQRDEHRDDSSSATLMNNPPCNLLDTANDATSRSNKRGLSARHMFAHYFTDIAPLPWQDEIVA